MIQKIKLQALSYSSKIRKSIFGKYAVSVTYNTENGLLSLPIEDFAIGRKLGFQGKWDLEELNYLSKIITDKDTVYIIGTHVGALLIPLSIKSKKVVGFEANPTTFDYLKTNIFLNNVKNTDIFNYAVGDKIGKLEFLQNKVNSGGSKIVPQINNFSFSYDKPNKIEVDMIALDDFIIKNQLQKPDVLIVDIEGAEFIALQGMKESIKDCKCLYIEFEPNHLKFVSNCSTNDFFNLFIDEFSKVSLMRKNITFNLNEEKGEFYKLINKMFENNVSDDLLLVK